MTETKQIVFDTVEEPCPYCDALVELPAKLGVYECPICHKQMITCSMCEDMHCKDCKFKN